MRTSGTGGRMKAKRVGAAGRKNIRRQCRICCLSLESDEKNHCCQDCWPIYSACVEDRTFTKAVWMQPILIMAERSKRVKRHRRRVWDEMAKGVI